MASQFSRDGKYFAQISSEGKLKVWETATSTLQQEFTPDFHLTSPCSCLHFVEPDTSTSKNGSPKKKIKRRKSNNFDSPYITLGTSSGNLFGYSISKGDLDFTIKSGTNQPISCLSWRDGDLLFSGAEQHVICWDLEKRSIKSKWKTGNERITAILALSDNNKILTACKNIKLWDVSKKSTLKIFTGHSYEVTILQYINPTENGEYFVSGSKGDRVLSCWNLDESQRDTNSVVTFLLEDVPCNVSVIYGPDGTTNMAVCVRSGVVHVYQHTLNGKCPKPLKPKATLQIASDTGQNESVSPIAIVSAMYNEDLTLLIGHGNAFILTFENVTINKYQKLQCLVRKDPRSVKASKDSQVSKIKAPVVDDSVQYVTPQVAVATKRKGDANDKMDIPMEKRLENLTLSKLDGDGKSRVDNVAQLLLQGIHSKDKNILKSALSRKEETVIKNTVKRLPMQVIEPLVQELTAYVQGKTAMSQIGARWLRIVLQVHAAILISRPDLPELLGPTMTSLESRLALQAPLNRLRGRLDMIISQISGSGSNDNIETEPMVVFEDRDDESDSGAEGMDMSQSDNEWIDGEEEEEDEEEKMSEDEVNNADESEDDSD